MHFPDVGASGAAIQSIGGVLFFSRRRSLAGILLDLFPILLVLLPILVTPGMFVFC